MCGSYSSFTTIPSLLQLQQNLSGQGPATPPHILRRRDQLGQLVLDPADRGKGPPALLPVYPAILFQHIQSVPDGGSRDTMPLGQLVLGGKLVDLVLLLSIADLSSEQISQLLVVWE